MWALVRPYVPSPYCAKHDFAYARGEHCLDCEDEYLAVKEAKHILKYAMSYTGCVWDSFAAAFFLYSRRSA